MAHLTQYFKVYLIVSLGLFFAHSVVYSQAGTERLVTITLDSSQAKVTTDKQHSLLKKIKQRETTASVRIFKVADITEIANSTALRFGTQHETVYSNNNVEKEAGTGSMDLWQGKQDVGDPNVTTLIFDGIGMTGSVWLNEQLYKVEPLGDGVHAFIQFDQSKALKCGQPLEPPEDRQGGNSLNKSGAILQNDPPVIDVLVAYTTAAKNASGNINSLIKLAMAEANQSYENSDVWVRMNLVYTYEVNYNESGVFGTDLSRFRGTSDGYMDNVHSYRNQYHADVCVLITGSGDYAGIAYVGEGASYGFSVVRYDYTTGYYTFAHEIGHNQNCRHDICDDPSGTYNHGYEYCSGNWRTIMAYNQSCCTNGTTRLQYWSNPDKTYGGVAMGTTQDEDNARMLEYYSPYVAGYRTAFTSGTLPSDQVWYYRSLTGDVTVPSGVTLTISSGATVNLNGHSITSTGGLITLQTGATIDGLEAKIQISGQLKGLYPSIALAMSDATSEQTVSVPSGTYSVNSVLTIPAGVTLLFTPNSTITFQSDVKVYGYLQIPDNLTVDSVAI